MPFTPFHFGPCATIALPLRKTIDLPVFLLVNVVIDLEPLAVILLQPEYPLHGYLHTLLFGTLAAAAWACLAWLLRRPIAWGMKLVRLPYRPGFARMLLSAIFGAWLHVLLDAPLYEDMKPFYPLDSNPLLGTVTGGNLYLACALLFLPALGLYVYFAKKKTDV